MTMKFASHVRHVADKQRALRESQAVDIIGHANLLTLDGAEADAQIREIAVLLTICNEAHLQHADA
jgi:hypothetical protein